MCKKSHTKKKYKRNKEFQNGIKPSNPDIKNPIIKSKYHNHNLVYCRSSRYGWRCDVCQTEFANEIWSFYCTKCDFDLCSKCAGYQCLIF